MSKGQLTIVWVVGFLIACVLFYVGIGKPYLAAQNYPPPSPSGNPFVIARDPVSRQRQEDRKRQYQLQYQLEKSQATAMDYYVGAIGPILVLGVCAFLSTLKTRQG